MTKSENLIRLERSLAGKEKESVHSLLMDPTQVDEIITVLDQRSSDNTREIFRPEIDHTSRSLKERTQGTSPKDTLDEIIGGALTSPKGVYDTARNAQRDDHPSPTDKLRYIHTFTSRPTNPRQNINS